MINIISDTSQTYIIAFATLGWLLTLYFGFFRFKHYLWAKRKVQYDLFTKINQKNDRFFIKTTALTSISNRNQKVTAKRNAVLIKYLENFVEKTFLIKGNMVSKEIALFWINGMINELQNLAEQDENVIGELKALLNRKIIHHHQVDAIFSFIESGQLISEEKMNGLYAALIQKV